MLNLSGQKFGKLSAEAYEKSRRAWKCVCDCGNSSFVKTCNLTNGSVKSCGCQWHRRRVKASLKALWRRYKDGASFRGFEFNLTIEQFEKITSQICVYCGVPPQQIIKSYPTSEPYIFNGIDRKKNDEGYLLENSVPCCGRCNIMKRDLSVADFLAHVSKIVRNQESV